MRRIYTFILLWCFVFGIHAQPRIDFEQTTIDVGDIMFQHPKTVTFKFKNTGAQKLVINSIISSCNCATPQWNQRGVEPGETGFIKMTYNAAFLGAFHKELEVYTNVTEEPVYLVMEGRVSTSVSYAAEDYPIDLGNIKMSTNVVEYDNVNNGDNPEVVIDVVNVAQESYRPEIMHLPSYLSVRTVPEVLKKGQVGKIILQLQSAKLKDYGLTQTSIYLARYSGDKVCNENEIEVSALLLPAFAHLNTQELEQAPQLFLSEDSLIFVFSDDNNTDIWQRAIQWVKKTVTRKEQQTKRIIISNLGKTDLIFSNVQIYGKALSISLSNKTIPAGGQGELAVSIDKNLMKRSKAKPRVLLIDNDPRKPKVIIPIKIL